MSRLLLALFSISVGQAIAGSFTWEEIAPATPPPPARAHHAFGYFAQIQTLIVFGGRGTDGTILGDTWGFAFDDYVWKQLNTTTSPPAREFMASGVVESLGWFVIAAGADSNTDYNDIWVLDFGVDLGAINDNNGTTLPARMPEWYQLTVQGELPEVRYGGHGGVYPMNGTSFWLGFGFNKKEETGKRLGDTFRIAFTNTSTVGEVYQWESIHEGVGLNQYHPFLPHARCLQSGTMTDEEQLVFHGGCLRGGVGGGPCPAEDAWVLDGNTKEWSELPRCVTPRVFGAMVSIPRRRGMGLLYGGDDRFDNGIVEQVIAGPRYPANEVVLVDANMETWTRKKTLPTSRLVNDTEVFDKLPARRFGHGMASGSSRLDYVDSEGEERFNFTDRIVMFGGVGLYGGQMYNDIWVLTGEPESSADLSGDCPAVWFSYLHLHGILLSVAWGMLFPTGVLVARYYRCGESQAWLLIHVILQLTALALSSVAFVMVFLVSSKPNFPHAIIGIILQIFAIQQPVNGFLRPHKKDDNKTSRNRYCWELWHKSTGYFTVLAGLVNVTLGVFLIIPPLAVWVVWLCAIAVWVVIFAIYETIHLLKVCECTGQREARDTELVTYPGY